MKIAEVDRALPASAPQGGYYEWDYSRGHLRPAADSRTARAGPLGPIGERSGGRRGRQLAWASSSGAASAGASGPFTAWPRAA